MSDSNPNIDPMLTSRSVDYSVRLMEKVDAMIEEDRATFRRDLKKPIENPPLMFGATGFGGGNMAS